MAQEDEAGQLPHAAVHAARGAGHPHVAELKAGEGRQRRLDGLDDGLVR